MGMTLYEGVKAMSFGFVAKNKKDCIIVTCLSFQPSLVLILRLISFPVEPTNTNPIFLAASTSVISSGEGPP